VHAGGDRTCVAWTFLGPSSGRSRICLAGLIIGLSMEAIGGLTEDGHAWHF